MQKCTGWYPSLRVDGSAERVVSVAGSVLLVKTATAVGLDRGLATALAPRRKPHAVHDPGKVLLDLALAVAIGGDCLADIGQLRSVPAVFGPVASDPTVSRLIDALATDPDAALAAIDRARASQPAPGVAPGRRRCPGPQQHRNQSVDRGPGRIVGHGPLGKGISYTDLQTWFWFSSAVGVRRSRHARHR